MRDYDACREADLEANEMKVAFHFELPLGPAETEAEVAVIRSLSRIQPHRRHLRIFRGIVGPMGLPTGEGLTRLAKQIVSGALAATIDAARLRQLLAGAQLFVFMVDGITHRQANRVHNQLTAHPAYAGLITLDDRVAKHWVLYQLPAAYRLIGDELRIQHTFDALEGDPEEWHGRVESWKQRRMFANVVLEDLSLQQTLFDPFETVEHARRRGETALLIEDQLSGVGNDVLLRLSDLDPGLLDTVHAALTAFETAATAEQRAQVALALRRLLQRLANALFPATDEVREGRKLGRAQYRNRLWAYVEDHTSGSRRKSTLSALEDLGGRIDRLDDLTNAGLHDEVDPSELQRLLIAVVALVYDLLLLAPPPASIPYQPYDKAFRQSLRDMLNPSDE